MGEQLLSLPTGTWKIYGNEQHGDLIISSVDGFGKLKGTAYGSDITGSFNWSSGQIHFVRQVKPNLPDWETYTGYMSIVATNVDSPQYLLAGFYVSSKHLTSLRHHFGWYATPTRVSP